MRDGQATTKMPAGRPAFSSFHCFCATLADGPDGAAGGGLLLLSEDEDAAADVS